MKCSNIDATCTSELLYICIYNIKQSQRRNAMIVRKLLILLKQYHVISTYFVMCPSAAWYSVKIVSIQPALEILLVHVSPPNTHTWRYITPLLDKTSKFLLTWRFAHCKICLTKKKVRYYSYSTITVNIKNKCFIGLWCPSSISYFDSASWSVGAHVHNIWTD